MGPIKSENCNLATIENDSRRRLVLLQTLRSRDFEVPHLDWYRRVCERLRDPLPTPVADLSG